MSSLEGKPKFCLEGTASSFGCDLAEVVVEAASGIGQPNGICRSRMIQHVQRVHTKLDGFRFADPESLAQVSIEVPARERLHREASQISLSTRNRILKKRNPESALRHLYRAGSSSRNNLGQALQCATGLQVVFRCHVEALRILESRVLRIAEEISSRSIPRHVT